MTERERVLLQELLTQAETPPAQEAYEALNERELLNAVNAIGPVTLVGESDQPEAAGLVHDVATFVQRYPIPTALAVAGIAYLLLRRRR